MIRSLPVCESSVMSVQFREIIRGVVPKRVGETIEIG
jgi:hypothetical protein